MDIPIRMIGSGQVIGNITVKKKRMCRKLIQKPSRMASIVWGMKVGEKHDVRLKGAT